MTEFKGVVLGIFIGSLVTSILMYRFMVTRKYFVVPEKVHGDQVEYRIPDDLICCRRLTIDSKGYFHIEYQN